MAEFPNKNRSAIDWKALEQCRVAVVEQLHEYAYGRS